MQVGSVSGSYEYPGYNYVASGCRKACIHGMRSLPVLKGEIRLRVYSRRCRYVGSNYRTAAFARAFSNFLGACDHVARQYTSFVYALTVRSDYRNYTHVYGTLNVGVDKSAIVELLLEGCRILPKPRINSIVNISSFTCGGQRACKAVVMGRRGRRPVTLLSKEGKSALES